MTAIACLNPLGFIALVRRLMAAISNEPKY
jgi:hypothetical protein